MDEDETSGDEDGDYDEEEDIDSEPQESSDSESDELTEDEDLLRTFNKTPKDTNGIPSLNL